MSSTTASSLSSNSTSPIPSEPFLWDVQQILAERTSVCGANEVLVVMKVSWVPINSIYSDCPAMQRFKKTVKCTYSSESGAMSIKLPVEPGSMLAQDSIEDEQRVTDAAARAPAAAAAMRDTPFAHSHAAAHCARCTLSICSHQFVIITALTMQPRMRSDRTQENSTKSTTPSDPRGPKMLLKCS